MSGSEQQPGNTWVICEDEDGGVNVTVILGFGVIFLLVSSAILCGLWTGLGVCRRRSREEEFVEVISEAGSEAGQLGGQDEVSRDKEDTGICMNCLLIEMGEMVCYSDRCPDCGKVPPGRNIKQQLAVKKTVTKWKRNVGGGGANTANGNAATAAAGQSPTSAQNQNYRNGGKKQSMVIAKNPPGTRNLNVRNEGGVQGNYYNRNFV